MWRAITIGATLLLLSPISAAQWYAAQYEENDPSLYPESVKDWAVWQSGCVCQATNGTCEVVGPAEEEFAWDDVLTLGCSVFGRGPEGYVVHPTPLTLNFTMPFFCLRGGNADGFSFSISADAFVSLPASGIIPGYFVGYAYDLGYQTQAEWPLVSLWLNDFIPNSGLITVERRRYACRTNTTCGAVLRYGSNLTSETPSVLAAQLRARVFAFSQNITTSPPPPPAPSTSTVSVDSLIVTWTQMLERYPPDGSNRHNLTAQLELMSNGTILMRFEATPDWPLTEEWFIPNTGLSLGTLGFQQLFNVPTPQDNASNPLTFYALRLDPLMLSAASALASSGSTLLGSIDPCEGFLSCDACRTTMDCAWCPGAVPSALAPANVTGRCINADLASQLCPNPKVIVRYTSADNSLCDAQNIELALLAQGEPYMYLWSTENAMSLWPPSLDQLNATLGGNVSSYLGLMPNNVTSVYDLPEILATLSMPWNFSVLPWRPSVNASLECPPSPLLQISSQNYIVVGDQGELASSARASLTAEALALANYCQLGVQLNVGNNPYSYCPAADVAYLDAREPGAPFCVGPDPCPQAVAIRWRGCLFNNQTASPASSYADIARGGLGVGFYTTEILLDVYGNAELRFPSAFTGVSNVTGYSAYDGLNSVGVYEQTSMYAPQSSSLGYQPTTDYSTDPTFSSLMAPQTRITLASLGRPCPRCQNGATCDLNNTAWMCVCPAPLIEPMCASCNSNWYRADPFTCAPCPSCQNGGSCSPDSGKCICPVQFYGPLCEFECAYYSNDAATWPLAMNFTAHSCNVVTYTNTTSLSRITLWRTIDDSYIGWATPNSSAVVETVDWIGKRVTSLTAAFPYPAFGLRGGAASLNATARASCVGGNLQSVLSVDAVSVAVDLSTGVIFSCCDTASPAGGSSLLGGISIWPTISPTSNGTVSIFEMTRPTLQGDANGVSAGNLDDVIQQLHALLAGQTPAPPSAATVTGRGETMQTLVLEWDAIQLGDAAGGSLTAQLELFPNGTFEMRYRNVPASYNSSSSASFLGAAITAGNDTLIGAFVTPPESVVNRSSNGTFPSFAVVRLDPVGSTPLTVLSASAVTPLPAVDLLALDPCEALPTCFECASESRCLWCDGAAPSLSTQEEANPSPILQGRCMSQTLALFYCTDPIRQLNTTGECPSTVNGIDPYQRYQKASYLYRQIFTSLAAVPLSNMTIPLTAAASLATLPMPENATMYPAFYSAVEWDVTVPFNVSLFPATTYLDEAPSTDLLRIASTGTVTTSLGRISVFSSTPNLDSLYVRVAQLAEREAPDPLCLWWQHADNASMNSSATSVYACPPAIVVEWGGVLQRGASNDTVAGGLCPVVPWLGTPDVPPQPGATLRLLLESDGDLTIAVGPADALGAGTSRLPWGDSVTIGIFSADGTVISSQLATPVSAQLGPFMAVTFTPTVPLPCSATCASRSSCDRVTAQCVCDYGYAGPTCEPCPAGTVYSVASSGAAGCATCPNCLNGGVCVANPTSIANASCLCPVGTGGPDGVCEELCPFGHQYGDLCPACYPPHICLCGVCYCNNDSSQSTDGSQSGGGCTPNSQAGQSTAILVLEYLLLVLIGIMVIAAIAKLVEYVHSKCRGPARRQAPRQAPAETAPPPMIRPPEPGTLRAEASNVPPGLLARLMQHYDPVAGEQATMAHNAVRNPLQGTRAPTAGGEQEIELSDL